MRSPVLILGAEDDPHVCQVRTQIHRLGGEVRVLDPWVGRWSLTASPCVDGLELRDCDNERVLPVGVWNRLKPMSSHGLSDSLAFAVRERTDLLRGIAQRFAAVAVNQPSAQASASLKLHQLCVAQSVGLTVPRTYVSDSADALIAVADEAPLLYKPLTWLATPSGEILFSKLVSRTDLLARRDALQVAPGIYQSYVKKARELRITIIDDFDYCVAIYSQERAETEVDWRRDQLGVRCEQIPTPLDLRRKLLTLMNALGLRFGAIDVIEDENGEYVFLEVNPSGNWLWLEDRLGIPISAVLARKLMQLIAHQ